MANPIWVATAVAINWEKSASAREKGVVYPLHAHCPNGKKVEVTLISGKPQKILLEMPGKIATISVTKGNASLAASDQDNASDVTLPANEAVSLKIELK